MHLATLEWKSNKVAVPKGAFKSSSRWWSESLILDADVYVLVLRILALSLLSSSWWMRFESPDRSGVADALCSCLFSWLGAEIEPAHTFPPARCVRGILWRRKAKLPQQAEHTPRGAECWGLSWVVDYLEAVAIRNLVYFWQILLSILFDNN